MKFKQIDEKEDESEHVDLEKASLPSQITEDLPLTPHSGRKYAHEGNFKVYLNNR